MHYRDSYCHFVTTSWCRLLRLPMTAILHIFPSLLGILVEPSFMIRSLISENSVAIKPKNLEWLCPSIAGSMFLFPNVNVKFQSCVNFFIWVQLHVRTSNLLNMCHAGSGQLYEHIILDYSAFVRGLSACANVCYNYCTVVRGWILMIYP